MIQTNFFCVKEVRFEFSFGREVLSENAFSFIQVKSMATVGEEEAKF